jgi:hypothetical protein
MRKNEDFSILTYCYYFSGYAVYSTSHNMQHRSMDATIHPVAGTDYPRTFQEFDEWFGSEDNSLATDGCFSGGGTFTVGPSSAGKDLEELFRHEVFKMLMSEGKIQRRSL